MNISFRSCHIVLVASSYIIVLIYVCTIPTFAYTVSRCSTNFLNFRAFNCICQTDIIR